MMRYMGWSWQDLMSAPFSIVQEVIQIINEKAEQAEMEELMRMSSGK